jgi:hypothetical protein
MGHREDSEIVPRLGVVDTHSNYQLLSSHHETEVIAIFPIPTTSRLPDIQRSR